MKKARSKREEAAVERFRQEVCLRSKLIDASGEQDWYSLSLGFFLGLGLRPERAHQLSVYVRYEKQYWHE